MEHALARKREANRAQSSYARAHGGVVHKNSYTARLQSNADRGLSEYDQGDDEYGYDYGDDEYGYDYGDDEYGYGYGEDEYGYGHGEDASESHLATHNASFGTGAESGRSTANGVGGGNQQTKPKGVNDGADAALLLGAGLCLVHSLLNSQPKRNCSWFSAAPPPKRGWLDGLFAPPPPKKRGWFGWFSEAPPPKRGRFGGLFAPPPPKNRWPSGLSLLFILLFVPMASVICVTILAGYEQFLPSE